MIQPQRAAGGGHVDRGAEEGEDDRLLDAQERHAAREDEVGAQENPSERREARRQPAEERHAHGDLTERHEEGEDPGVRDGQLREERHVEMVARLRRPAGECFLQLGGWETAAPYGKIVTATRSCRSLLVVWMRSRLHG